MIKVFTGNGKGKTTSAIGEASLACGQGTGVMMVQFLKGSTYMGELYGLQRLGIPLVQFGVGCRWSGMIRTGQKHCTGCGECFRQNRDPAVAGPLVVQGIEFLKMKIMDPGLGLIILDEVSHALKHGFLSIDILKELTDTGHKNLNWILTGRNMPEEILTWDTEWWELKPVKHPFQAGIRSRRGIEY